MRETFGLDQYQFTLGKWIVVIVGAVLMVGGGVIGLISEPEPEPTATVTKTSTPDTATAMADGLMNSLTDGGGISLPIPGLTNAVPDMPEPASTPVDDSIGSRDVSKMAVKGGFGLFMGFAIGFAIRAFLRLAAVIVGFYFLTLTVLAYLGWIEIHWHVIEGQANGLIGNLGAQFESFKAFLTGSIPSSGAAATGLAIGLKKK